MHSKSARSGFAPKMLDCGSRWTRRPNVSASYVHMTCSKSDAVAVIARMQQMNVVVEEINNQAREAASMYEASLELFSVSFDKLLGQHAKEFDRYRLDEVVVAAIAPVVCPVVMFWWKETHCMRLDPPDAGPVATFGGSHCFHFELSHMASCAKDGCSGREAYAPSSSVWQQYSRVSSCSRVRNFPCVVLRLMLTPSVKQGEANDSVRKFAVEHLVTSCSLFPQQRLVARRPGAGSAPVRSVVNVLASVHT